jgi:hypothetical protein
MMESPSRLTLLQRVNNLVPVAYCIPCSGIPFPTVFAGLARATILVK